MEYTVGTIIIMIIVTVLLGYYINSTISFRQHKTHNLLKYYGALFVGLQMGILELICMYRYQHGLDRNYVILFFFLLVAMIYVGVKLYTLSFMNEKEFMLASIEDHSLGLAMAHNVKTENPVLQEIIERIKTKYPKEIQDMQDILKAM